MFINKAGKVFAIDAASSDAGYTGLDTYSGSYLWKETGSFTNAVKVSGGKEHSIVLKAGGTVSGWDNCGQSKVGHTNIVSIGRICRI